MSEQKPCPRCGGRGEYTYPNKILRHIFGPPLYWTTKQCPDCKGTGEIAEYYELGHVFTVNPCPACHGSEKEEKKNADS